MQPGPDDGLCAGVCIPSVKVCGGDDCFGTVILIISSTASRPPRLMDVAVNKETMVQRYFAYHVNDPLDVMVSWSLMLLFF